MLLLDWCDLSRNVDTVEFSPFDIPQFFPVSSCNDIFLSGSYELNVSLEKRWGNVSLFAVRDDCVDLLLSKDCDEFGVLDSKWVTAEQFAVACSDSCCRLFEISGDDSSANSVFNVNEKSKFEIEGNLGEIVLSLDVTTDNLVCASNKGNLYLINTGSQSVDIVGNHQCEIWTCSFSQSDPNLIFSGSDDCFLNVWDNRMSRKIFKIEHPSGVCSVQTEQKFPALLFTGCYDDSLRIFDLRFLETMTASSGRLATALSSVDIGGGPWRIKFNPMDKDLIGIAAMYEGYKLLRDQRDISEAFSNPRENKLLAYGFDWSRKNPKHCVSCSFYDRIVSLWSI